MRLLLLLPMLLLLLLLQFSAWSVLGLTLAQFSNTFFSRTNENLFNYRQNTKNIEIKIGDYDKEYKYKYKHF